MRVLLIDDAAISRAAFTRVARAVGIDVVGEAAGVEEGLALAARLRPDAIVVDGRIVPDLASGFVARIRAQDASVPVFVVAALAETALVRAAVAAGASGAVVAAGPRVATRAGPRLARRRRRGCIAADSAN